MSNCPPGSTIKEWEEAGASLVIALKDYVHLCLNLGNKSLFECENAKDLVSNIESTLAGVHATMTRHLNESRSALVRTRNHLKSPFLQLPDEIISKIFINAVFDHRIADEPMPLKQETWYIYRRLYTLIGVCSAWRDIAMNRGALWSVIPIVASPFIDDSGPFELSLERAGGSPLHLAAATEFTNSRVNLAAILAEHGHRFHTINISMDSPAEIRDAISGLLQRNDLRSLSELSIQCITTRTEPDRLPLQSDYILPLKHLQWLSFARLVRGLTALRIGGALFYWATMSFPTTVLVELVIQQVTLGYDEAVISFMKRLSSAPNLQDLKIIAVSTIRHFFETLDPAGPPRQPPHATVTFPALRSLLLQDLYVNTLDHLLPILRPGSYSLTLFLTHKCLETNAQRDLDFNGVTEFEDLCSAIRRTSIDTLMIDGSSRDEWLMTTNLRALLKAIPSLKTLKIHRWNFGKGLCKCLMRINSALTPPDGPTFQNLHLTSVRIHAKQGFQDMISSHSLHQLVLGGEYQVIHPDDMNNQAHLQEIQTNRSQLWEPVRGDSDIVQEIKGNISDLRLVESGYQPPEFRTVVWKLW